MVGYFDAGGDGSEDENPSMHHLHHEQHHCPSHVDHNHHHLGGHVMIGKTLAPDWTVI